MNSQKMSAAAVAWMKTLPPTLLVKRTTPLNLAAKDPINAEKTLRVLYDFYASRRDTQELYRVLVHLEKVRPTDRSVRNNLAQISSRRRSWRLHGVSLVVRGGTYFARLDRFL